MLDDEEDVENVSIASGRDSNVKLHYDQQQQQQQQQEQEQQQQWVDEGGCGWMRVDETTRTIQVVLTRTSKIESSMLEDSLKLCRLTIYYFALDSSSLLLLFTHSCTQLCIILSFLLLLSPHKLSHRFS
jgi:hypothetical protein